MRISALLMASTFLFVQCYSLTSSAGRIEADPNKKYTLSKSRGPWMIMAATFHSTGSETDKHEGKTPEQAAQELVLELRQLGLPAYTYTYDPGQQNVAVQDRTGREERRKNLRRVKSTCVVAGNYGDINDKVAQQTLKWVKSVHPKCLRQGVVYKPTPGRPGPLSGAFLTVNPMLSAEEVQQRRTDPLLVKLNGGERDSLFENKGKYTLVVARFYGKTLSADVKVPWVKSFLKDNDLDTAGRSARELCTALRGNFDKENGMNNVDAFVWHDRHESIVTVGSFNSENDPRIEKYKKLFGPKMKSINGQQVFQAEHFGVSGYGKDRKGERLWLFEPNIVLMNVPNPR